MQQESFRTKGMMNHHPHTFWRSSVAILITEQGVNSRKQTWVNSQKCRSVKAQFRLLIPMGLHSRGFVSYQSPTGVADPRSMKLAASASIFPAGRIRK
jgi:hypothetical protein